MQYRVVAADVAAGRAGSGQPGGAGALPLTHAPGLLVGGAGVLSAELRRQARDIAAKSWPMLLPAGMFVMQQARGLAVGRGLR